MRCAATLLLILTSIGCATHQPPYHATLAQLAARPMPKEGPNVLAQLLRKTNEQSIHLVRLRNSLPAHRHDFHDETVVVLRGTGKMQLGNKTVSIVPGSILHIPSGVPHSVTIDPGQEAAAVSIFVPPFQGEDRVFSPSPREIDEQNPFRKRSK